jgi:hypothetical protein
MNQTKIFNRLMDWCKILVCLCIRSEEHINNSQNMQPYYGTSKTIDKHKDDDKVHRHK